MSKFKEILECYQCRNVYDRAYRKPLIICHIQRHTICQPCAINMLTASCPICKEPVIFNQAVVNMEYYNVLPQIQPEFPAVNPSVLRKSIAPTKSRRPMGSMISVQRSRDRVEEQEDGPQGSSKDLINNGQKLDGTPSAINPQRQRPSVVKSKAEDNRVEGSMVKQSRFNKLTGRDIFGFILFFLCQIPLTVYNIYLSKSEPYGNCMDNAYGQTSYTLRTFLLAAGILQIIIMVLCLLIILFYKIKCYNRLGLVRALAILCLLMALKMSLWSAVMVNMLLEGLKQFCSLSIFIYCISMISLQNLILLGLTLVLICSCTSKKGSNEAQAQAQ